MAALALRLFHLDTQSFWGDEGSTAAMARRGVADIVERSANDISPPGYYLLYRGWAGLVGDGEFASRFLSALASVATIALTYALGRRVAGERAALLAGLAAALSPYALYYAQEARMYALLAALGAASWLALLAMGRRPRRATVAYILLSLAILFTQYFGIAILVAQNLAWLLATLRARRWARAHWLRWIAIQAMIGLAFLPWFLRVRENLLGWPATSAPVTPAFMASELGRLVTVGPSGVALPLWVAVVVGVVALVGVFACVRGAWTLRVAHGASRANAPTPKGVEVSMQRQRAGARRAPLHGRTLHALRSTPHAPRSTLHALAPLALALVPPLLMFIISLDRPFWNPKFLLMALPGFHLLFGIGAEAMARLLPGRALRRVLPAVVAALLIVVSARPLAALYFDPATWRDDYRAIARTISAQAGPRDAVLLAGPGQIEIFDYYAPPALARYPLPSAQPLNPAATERELGEILAAHPRLFVLWWAERESDPAGLIPSALARDAFPLGSRWYGNVRVESFLTMPPGESNALDITFTGEGAELTLVEAAVGPRRVVAGEGVAIEAMWRGAGVLPPLTLFAQLLDAGGNVVGQYDGLGGAPPSAQWGDASQRARMGVPVPVETPPGDYALIIGAYRADSGARLLPSEGDAHRLATITVERPTVLPSLDALALAHGEARSTSFGHLTLVGAAANRLGSDHEPAAPLASGDALSIRLAWRAERDAPDAPPLALRLLRADGAIAAEWGWEPTEGRHPPGAWVAGEVVRDPQRRTLPANLAPGRYTLVLEGGGVWVTVGTVEVR